MLVGAPSLCATAGWHDGGVSLQNCTARTAGGQETSPEHSALVANNQKVSLAHNALVVSNECFDVTWCEDTVCAGDHIALCAKHNGSTILTNLTRAQAIFLISFRCVHHTHAPWGCIVRAANPTKST